ncbi:MAG TPA: endo-1,4-beta-xylanase [Rariglobus sp.]|nr:endo-1,4-beta-xylanase [Rariglobus sp.]
MNLNPLFVARVVLCVAVLAGVASAAAGVELLRNGDFAAPEATDKNLPAGWELSGSGGEVRWNRAAAGGAEIWLGADEAGQAPAMRQETALSEPPPSAVMLRGEVKLDGVERGERKWYSGRLLVTYLDANGQVLGETYTLDRLTGTADWRAVRRQFPVPAGARRVRLELQLLQPKAGRIGFRGVSLQALDEAEAQAWRVEAEARIREHRMAPLRVRVEDAQGRAVSSAEVAVFMRRHAYPFGTAVSPALLLAPPGKAQADTYRSVVENFFNYATLENGLKTKTVEVKGLEAPLAALGWLRERNIALRGHVLTWPSLEMSSKAENAAKDDPEALRAVMRRLFRERLEATAPYGLADWDVMNEPTVHNDLLRILGDGQAAEWFRWAREDAPRARLYLNENNVEFAGGNREGLEQWIRRLQAAGAPIGGIGWQGHMWHRTLPSGQNILDDLDYFAPYGLPVQITEYDADNRFSDEDEARFLDEFLTAWFSHPLTAGFIMWGFQDSLIWNGNAPLFRADWSLKPAGKVWMERVFGRWWTEERGRSDGAGAYEVRGFLGDYEVEAVHGGRREVAAMRLGPEGARVVLRLPEAEGAAARLVSSNPYTGGKLPVVRAPDVKRPQDFETRIVRPEDGRGALALSPAGEGRVLTGGEDGRRRRDLYVRFDTAASAADVDGAVFRVRLAGVPEKTAKVKVLVLSNRFVPQGREAGADWTAADLEAGRAPGRDVVTGDYRLGDAAVIYLGEAACADADARGVLVFSSPELARAVAQSREPGVTVILSTTASRLEAVAVELELRVKKAKP